MPSLPIRPPRHNCLVSGFYVLNPGALAVNLGRGGCLRYRRKRGFARVAVIEQKSAADYRDTGLVSTVDDTLCTPSIMRRG